MSLDPLRIARLFDIPPHMLATRDPLAVCEFCGRETADPTALCQRDECQAATSERDSVMTGLVGKELDDAD